ncbi:pneumococcal serine-rich repeat protein-like [Hetaerina americana]|uniref:pneumococcal serine-rich repeat protein-like n=1 Tax=Hetaerina americana TaxID=62018 RepID=UPI003A7F2663
MADMGCIRYDIMDTHVYPASLSQLRRWTSSEALGSPTVTLGAPRIERHRPITMPPAEPDSQQPPQPELEEELPDHRLPSPEEQVNAVAMRFQPEMVMVDVSGRAFDRMALFRRSLTHVNCPPEDEGKVKRRTKGGGKRGRRRKRRNTIAGTGDKELREALGEEGPSTSAAAAALENPGTSGGAESPDIPDAEVTSIGMSSSASSAPASAALDKKSHFENIRQWTRSKLRGSMAAVSRARSAGRESQHEDPADQNVYEVVRRRERGSTSLPISTLSGAMSMAVKLRQGAARRAGLTSGSSRSSSGKGPGSADTAINSSSGNWSGSSSARASLESEEPATQQPQPQPIKVPPPASSVSTAPPSTTTSCSAATSSASSTASSSGGSSATNSLGRRDSTSTASVTGHPRRRHDSRPGPTSSSSSVPNSSSTARAMSTSSEGTLTPDLVTIPFADDGETSSVYSCDTEGYYTSFHMDSGLKTLREEEAATVAAFIANGGLGGCMGNDDGPVEVPNNTSSAIAENEYELFGKGSTSTTTSSAGTVCTTLMVRDRPAVPPRQSSLDTDQRQHPCRSVTVVHAIPNDDNEEVDSGHNTTSSSSASSSPTSTGWNECDYEFSESDLEGVERIERIRVKTTINSSRIPSMCVITPPQSDDEGGSGKVTTPAPIYNTLPRSPSKKNKCFNLESNSLATSASVKSGGSLDNLSRVVVSSITGSSKLQVINVSSTGYATVKTVEGNEETSTNTNSNLENVDSKTTQNNCKDESQVQSKEESKSSNLHPNQKGPLTKPFNIMGMVKGVLSSAAGAVKYHGAGKSGGTDNDSITHKSNPVDYDRDGEYVTIAEVEKARGYPVPPVTSAKTFPAFRDMEYVSLNELTANPMVRHQPPMQGSTSSPGSSLERNKRRQGARVTLDSEGKVVYSSDSLTRRWKNGKAPTSTFEPGPHVRSSSPSPASPLPNRIPKTNIRPVNSTASYNIPPSKPVTAPLASPVTSPTHLGRRLIIRPGNQQQSPVVEAVPTKAAVTALPGPVSPKLPHQGAYVNMQMRREQLGCGSPSVMRSPKAGKSPIPSRTMVDYNLIDPCRELCKLTRNESYRLANYSPLPGSKFGEKESMVIGDRSNGVKDGEKGGITNGCQGLEKGYDGSKIGVNTNVKSRKFYEARVKVDPDLLVRSDHGLPNFSCEANKGKGAVENKALVPKDTERARVLDTGNDTEIWSSTPNPGNNYKSDYCDQNPLNSSVTKTNALSHHFFNKSPPVSNNNNPPSSPYGDKQQPPTTDLYCFKTLSPSNHPSQRWLVDSNHNVMHTAAPTSSTPTSKTASSLPRHFDGMSPIKNSSPISQKDRKINEIPRMPLSTFSAHNGVRANTKSSPSNNEKAKDIEQMPLFTTKSTMPTDEFFALIHRSKKKMNIRTDLDSPVHSSSPGSHSSLSPGSSESSLVGAPTAVSGSRHSWSPPDAKPSSPPSVSNHLHSSAGTRLSWAGNCNASTPPTSRTDFKRLLLQQRHGGGNRVSAAERLKVGKFGGSVGNTPGNGSSSPVPMNGNPRCLNLLPMNNVVTPRNRIGSARRFASPRTDVLSSPIPEDKDGEEIGNDQKGSNKKTAVPTHMQNGNANTIQSKISPSSKLMENSFTNSKKVVGAQVNGISKSPELSSPSAILGKSQWFPSNKLADHNNSKFLNNHVTKTILHTPSPTLGALLSKQRRQISPDNSLGPKVKSILEAIQVSKAKSPSKLALETAL